MSMSMMTMSTSQSPNTNTNTNTNTSTETDMIANRVPDLTESSVEEPEPETEPAAEPETEPEPVLEPVDFDAEVDEADYDYDYGYGYDYGNGYGYGDGYHNDAAALATAANVPGSPSLSKAMRRRRRSSLSSAASAKHRMRRRASLSYKGEIQVRLADRSTVRRAVSIGFAEERNQICEVETFKHTEHKDDLWFQPHEEHTFREKASFVVDYARQIGPDETERKQIHTRGLEPYIYQEEFQEKRKSVVAAVLQEQYQQRCRGEYNEQSIGKAYTNQSSYCQEMAQIQADMDYFEIKTEHQQTRRHMMMRRSSC